MGFAHNQIPVLSENSCDYTSNSHPRRRQVLLDSQQTDLSLWLLLTLTSRVLNGMTQIDTGLGFGNWPGLQRIRTFLWLTMENRLLANRRTSEEGHDTWRAMWIMSCSSWWSKPYPLSLPRCSPLLVESHSSQQSKEQRSSMEALLWHSLLETMGPEEHTHTFLNESLPPENIVFVLLSITQLRQVVSWDQSTLLPKCSCSVIYVHISFLLLQNINSV